MFLFSLLAIIDFFLPQLPPTTSATLSILLLLQFCCESRYFVSYMLHPQLLLLCSASLCSPSPTLLAHLWLFCPALSNPVFLLLSSQSSCFSCSTLYLLFCSAFSTLLWICLLLLSCSASPSFFSTGFAPYCIYIFLFFCSALCLPPVTK